MNNDDIRKAYDRLTPDEETKERMLRAIMARSAEMEQEASAKPVIVPWYVRLRVPMGISAAAMACAMVFTLASNNPELVQNGALRQEMLETKPAATTIVTENEVPAETETKPAETTAEAVQTAITASTTAQTPTTTAAVENFLNTSSTGVITTAAPKPVTSEVVTTPSSTEAVTTTEAVETVTTTAETVQTTEITTLTEATETTAASTTLTTKGSPAVYGNYHDYNHVIWNGVTYATSYEEVSYEMLRESMGLSIAIGESIGGSYTILLYSIDQMPVGQGFAVQYAGQETYYLFLNID